MQSEDHRRTALQYPLVHWTLCRCQQYGAFSIKALARYQFILLGEQRHIRGLYAKSAVLLAAA